MAFVENKASSSKPKGPNGGKKQAGRPKDAKQRVKSNVAKRQRIDQELAELQARVDSYVPPTDVTLFSQLPLSSRTLKGLKSSHFLNPTAIQALAIPPAIQGRDVLGSAKTGSGKTLAFLIPMLERLYLLKWGPMDGLGAVVISPTRELAVQTFNQLRDIGKYHSFSAGLIIGGKPLKEEQDRLGRMNILIATPGRLLQHLDSTVGFESSGVKCLVLDEADRLLDLGFLPALRAIVGHFASAPSASGKSGRQTLLFSATQSADLSALAKLSLHDPLYINCNKPGEEGVVPSNLEQFYAVVNLDRKLDALWGFIKSHLKMKGVVFVTSGKQVRFIFETFKRLHPGLPLLHLHGKQKQPTRLDIFQRFSTSKSALLICTDVAARGLDFPSVDWVIQLDCPDDVDTYIHRVGRTARYQAEGKALCLLCPSEEEGMVKRWSDKGLDVKKIRIKESRMGDLRQQMQNFAFKEPEIKYLGQRAFISYMRSVHIQKDKTIFKLSELPAEAYAASMGLPGAPQIRLLDGKAAKTRGPAEVKEIAEEALSREVVNSDESEGEGEDEDEEAESESEEDDEEESASEGESKEESGSEESDDDKPRTAAPVRTKYDRMFERKNQSILTPHYNALVAHDDDLKGEAEDGSDDDDDVFKLARRDHDLEEEEDELSAADLIPANRRSAGNAPAPLVSSEDLSKRKLKAGASKKAKVKNGPMAEKLVFDEEGNARDFYEAGIEAEQKVGALEKRKEFVEKEREAMREADKVDRAVAREAKREKKRKRKEREKELAKSEMEGYSDDGAVAVLGGGDHSDQGGFSADEQEPDEPRVEKGKRQKVDRAVEDDEELALRLLRGE